MVHPAGRVNLEVQVLCRPITGTATRTARVSVVRRNLKEAAGKALTWRVISEKGTPILRSPIKTKPSSPRKTTCLSSEKKANKIARKSTEAFSRAETGIDHYGGQMAIQQLTLPGKIVKKRNASIVDEAKINCVRQIQQIDFHDMLLG